MGRRKSIFKININKLLQNLCHNSATCGFAGRKRGSVVMEIKDATLGQGAQGLRAPQQ